MPVLSDIPQVEHRKRLRSTGSIDMPITPCKGTADEIEVKDARRFEEITEVG